MYRALAFVAFLVVFCAKASPTAIELQLVPAEGRKPCTDHVSLALVLESPGSAAAVEERQLLSAGLPGNLVVDLPAGSRWRLAVEAPDCWAPSSVLNVLQEHTGDGNREAAKRLEVWPSAILRGTVEAPRGQGLPNSLELRLSRVEGEAGKPPAGVWPATSICPVEKAAFICLLPAVPLDIRIAAEGFVPHYLWGVKLMEAPEHDLGLLSLEVGSSVSGWVDVPADGPPATAVTLELAPELPGGEAGPYGERLGRRRLTAHANERGFFQMRQVAPGSYELQAVAPGLSPRRLQPLEVEAGTEMALEAPLVLSHLGELEVILRPPMDPDGEPWAISVQRFLPLSQFLKPVAVGAASSSGIWELEGLEEGTYLVTVQDRNGSHFARRQIEVLEGVTGLEIELPWVAVEGALSAGGEPLAGQLVFVRRDASIRATTDEHGWFSTVLPREGEWRVRLLPLSHRGERDLQSVQVTRPGSGEPAQIVLNLPGTRLRGEVVDEDGKGIDGAVLTISQDLELIGQFYSGEEGRFDIPGLPEGTLKVRAEAEGERMSEALEVRLRETTPESLEIRVRPQRRLNGQVLTEGRPVAGAIVRVQHPESTWRWETVTAPNGRFSLRLPPDAQQLDALILSPGLPIKLLRLAVVGDDDPQVHITLGPGGHLTVPLQQSLFVRRDGGFFPWWDLLLPSGTGLPREVDSASGSLKVWVEAGVYAACPEPSLSASCWAGTVPPGGSLVLGGLKKSPEPDRDKKPTVFFR